MSRGALAKGLKFTSLVSEIKDKALGKARAKNSFLR